MLTLEENKKMVAKKSIEVWKKQASRDFTSARNSFASRDYYVCALLCQQAAEKALKYISLKGEKKLVRTHDLVKLARDINAPDDIILKCSKINPVYAEVRYPEESEFPASKVNKQEADSILNLTKEILQWVRKQH